MAKLKKVGIQVKIIITKKIIQKNEKYNHKFKRQMKALNIFNPDKDGDCDDDVGASVDAGDSLVEIIPRKREK